MEEKVKALTLISPKCGEIRDGAPQRDGAVDFPNDETHHSDLFHTYRKVASLAVATSLRLL
jgi:hypothetical protein